jgi:hypothetical protein
LFLIKKKEKVQRKAIKKIRALQNGAARSLGVDQIGVRNNDPNEFTYKKDDENEDDFTTVVDQIAVVDCQEAVVAGEVDVAFVAAQETYVSGQKDVDDG